MKTMHLLWGLSLVAGWHAGSAAVPSAQENGVLSPAAWAQVILPYAEMKALWETAADRNRPGGGDALIHPPVATVLLSADYELGIRGERALLKAKYRVRSWADGWHLVPLLGGQAWLEQVTEADSHGLMWCHDRYCLVTQGPGDIELEAQFALPALREWTASKPLTLRPGPASLHRLRISGLPEGLTPHLEGLEPVATEPGSATFYLPADPPDLQLRLQARSVVEPPWPSRWELQTETLLHYEPGKMIYQSHLYAQADSGSGLDLELLLPANTVKVEVEGEDLVRNELSRREEGPRRLRLEWQTRDVLDREVHLTYQVPQSPLSTNWLLQAPRLAEGGPVRSLFVMVAHEGLELTGPNLRGSALSPPVPDWVAGQLGARDYFTAEATDVCELAAAWLPRVRTSQAVVRRAEYRTRVVSDGSLLVEAELAIDHQGPLNWRVQMPEVDEMLSCQVGGGPAQPIRRGPGEIELALPAPAHQTSQVTFAYAAKVASLDRVVGRLELELPRTDLFVHELRWLLTLPEAYEATAIQGNVEMAPSGASLPGANLPDGSGIALRKLLIRNEAPAVEIHYQRRDLNEAP